MAHVQIRNHPDGGVLQVIVDGHDLSNDAQAAGPILDIVGDEVVLRLTLVVDVLDVDLPDAVVAALRAPRETAGEQ